MDAKPAALRRVREKFSWPIFGGSFSSSFDRQISQDFHTLRLLHRYCANQAYAKHMLEAKQRTNDQVWKRKEGQEEERKEVEESFFNVLHSFSGNSQWQVLQDLLESAFTLKLSRRMDLWTFLDAPRRRLQRYPILLRAILK
jgi:hypothetical protein